MATLTKKDTSGEMPQAYDPKEVEQGWYDWWVQSGFFKADPAANRPRFCMTIPPPNVTGALHIGHALMNSVEDCIARWYRLRGFDTLWIPATDHAGIATQAVVEKKLAKEGISKHELGREKFVQEVWNWKNEYGNRIYSQLRRMGSSVDWSRECFTLDDKRAYAVHVAFTRLYEQGLIYRDTRLINWSVSLRTALSDLEVDYVDIKGKTFVKVPGYERNVLFGMLWSFAYKVDGSDEEIVVATTRPETMLGDTAVAVHPEDDRYKHLHGKFVRHPFVDRLIPIITDEVLVDMSFGTGAVKITPAHDPNDFAVGKRHGLKEINVFTEDGRINSNGGSFEGMLRFEARVEVLKRLSEMGLKRDEQPNDMRLGLCQRSGDVIEPMLKPQWWVNCKDMAQQAMACVHDGRMRIIPDTHVATWERWLNNIRDWCISRQLWWGHRIPAYYIYEEGAEDVQENMERWVVADSEEEALAKARERVAGQIAEDKIRVRQDEDVLDTWFSSGLFPFSPLGWPEKTKEMEAYYPTNLLETGHDILFFWVARMVMMGLQLTGDVPFREVYLHAMVRDAHGRKMSKSLGNVIDPIDVIQGVSLDKLHKMLESGNLDPREVEKAKKGQQKDFPEGIAECGTDALRFALVAYTTQGRDINLDVRRVESYRHFCNKIWQATRYVRIQIGDAFVPPTDALAAFTPSAPRDRWIISRLNATIATCTEGMQSYDFSAATTAVYSFFLYDFCDYYLEMTKPVMSGDDEAAKDDVRRTLYTVLAHWLVLMHPFMPFVTEELYQRIPRHSSFTESICIAQWPEAVDAWKDDAIEAAMTIVQPAVRSARALRAAYNIAPKVQLEYYFQAKSDVCAAALKQQEDDLVTLTNASAVHFHGADEAAPEGCAVNIVSDDLTVYLVLKGMIDPAAEIKKLSKKRDKTEKQRQGYEKKFANEAYLSKVAEDVQQADREKYESVMKEIDALTEAIATMERLAA